MTQFRYRAVTLAAAVVLSGCAGVPDAGLAALHRSPLSDNELVVMSFNIRMIFGNDASRQSWLERREDVVQVIRTHSPTVVALQEVESRAPEPMPASEQLAYLMSELPEYAFACTPEPGLLSRQPILFDANRLRLLDEGMILEAPVDRYRSGFRGRIASWALFETKPVADSEPAVIRVINVHYHHLFTGSQLAWSLRIRQFLKQTVSEHEAVIVLGDFNLPAGSQLLDPLRTAGLHHALPPSRTGSYHFFTGITLWPRIDHIFVNDRVTAIAGYLDYSRSERGYPSDHFPVIARVDVGGR